MAIRSTTCQAAAALCLLAAAGCASQAGGTTGGSGHRNPVPAATGFAKQFAAAYLMIAVPANHQLDHEVDGYDDHAHHNLAAAESALRAEAATERRFDNSLLKIRFPHRIAVTALALVRHNQQRIDLTQLQAQSATYASLLSFTGAHKAADAGVEAQVRIIRRELGLPPPDNS
jgi:hypothetical protein